MYAFMALAISTLLITLMSWVTQQNSDLAVMYQSRNQYMQTVGMAEAIEQYAVENAAYPASLATLQAASGFEQTKSLTNTWQGYGVSGNIVDGTWTFTRAVLVSNDPSKGVSAAQYMTNNACGAGSYAAAESWCGASTGKWFRRETRETHPEKIATQRARLNRLLQKFGDYYNTGGAFPDKDAANVVLGANSINTLASLVSYAGTASGCAGTFNFFGMPVDCGDMFDLWGNPVGYQFVSSKHVLVTSETPIYNDLGTRVVVSADFDNSSY